MMNKFEDFIGLLNENIRYFMIENKRLRNMYIKKGEIKKILETFTKAYPKAKKFEIEIEKHIDLLVQKSLKVKPLLLEN